MLDIFGALFFVFPEVFELDDTSTNEENDDEGEVEVDVPHHVRVTSVFELLDEVEFVRVASSIEGDSTDEEVGSSERGGQNDGREEEDCGESSGNERTCNVNDPEERFRFGIGENSGVEQESSHETSPSSDAGTTESLAFEQQESSSESEDNRADQNNPSNPSFSLVGKESAVEKEENESHGDEGTDEEKGNAEQFSSGEAERETNDDQDSSPEPFVLLHESPESVEGVNTAVGFRCLVCRVVARASNSRFY